MLYQGIIGGGSSPVEPVDLSPVLLWTNSNPGTEFAAQTVSLDLTEYAGVIIEFNRAISSEGQWLANRSYIKKGEVRLGAGSMESTNIAARNMTCNDSGVTFEVGYTDVGANNNAIIPIKIYGVKEYVVEPVNTGIVRNFTVTDGNAATIDVGFKPSHVLVWTMSTNNAYVYDIYEDHTETYSNSYNPNWNQHGVYTGLNDNGFFFRPSVAAIDNKAYYIAIS